MLYCVSNAIYSDTLNSPFNLPLEHRVKDVLAPGTTESSGIGSSPGMVIAPNPDEWLLLDEEELLTDMMECGRLFPFFKCSTDDTAIELRDRGTGKSTTRI